MPRSFDVGGILLDPSAPVPRARKGKRQGGATTGIPAKESHMAKSASGGKSRKGRKGRKGSKGGRKGEAPRTTTSGPKKKSVGKSKWRSRGNHWGRQAAAALQVGGYYGKKKSNGRGKKRAGKASKSRNGFLPSVGGRRDVGLAAAGNGNGRTTMMGAAGTIIPAGVGIAGSMGLNMLYQWGVNKRGGTATSVAGNRWTALWNALTAVGLGFFATTRMMPRQAMVRNGLYGAAAGSAVLAVWQLLDSFLRDDATRTGHSATQTAQTAKAALANVTTPQQAQAAGEKVGQAIVSAAKAVAQDAQEPTAAAGAEAARGALEGAGATVSPEEFEVGGFDPYYIAAMSVGGPDLSALAASNPAGAGEVSDRVAQVSEGYTELTGRLQALGEPKTQAEVVVYNMTASALGDMHAALRQANLALNGGQLGAADRFAAYAAQYGVQAESNISGVEAGMAPEIAAAAVTDEVVPDMGGDLLPPELAIPDVTDMSMAEGTGGYYPMPFRHVSGQQQTVPAPSPASVTRFAVGSRTIDFDTISVWAQDASNRINGNLGLQPGVPGYVTASDMALAYVYWWDYYTNKRGYIYGLPQLDAYTGNSWSAVGSSPVSGPQPTAITINGQAYTCGSGSFAELQQAVKQLYNVAA